MAKHTKIYRFSKAGCDWNNTCSATSKKYLGGKGAALVDMCNAGMPVPPGFTLSTELCNQFRNIQASEQRDEFMADLLGDVNWHMEDLAAHFGFLPLVSVRSGAPVSMPGMMDTILNVGITDETLPQWVDRLGARAAYDSYRRLIQMLGCTAYGIPHSTFDNVLLVHKKQAKVDLDAELDADQMLDVVAGFKTAFKAAMGFPFPQTVKAQLTAAIRAVFDSWMNARAIEYRKLNKIDDAMGTAVNVQAMVFGNMGETSGSGVLFTRNPSTGEDVIMAEYLANAQGEDVVAGIRTPDKLVLDDSVNLEDCPAWMLALKDVCAKLEDAYQDMVDVEFTVQQGELFILQSRAGKRAAQAAFRIAVDLVDEGLIDVGTALGRIKREQFKIVKRPALDPSFAMKAHRTGLPACPGVVTGRPVYSAADAVAAKDAVILVTHETTPDDIAGMSAAVGILTQTGGATSHAAVVARAMDKPCITGCTDLNIQAMIDSGVDKVTIDGSTGRVWFQTDVPVVDGSESPEVKLVSQWCLKSSQTKLLTPVPLEIAHPQVVSAVEWWGCDEVMDAILFDLEQCESREHIILDMRGPQHLVDPADLPLLQAFGLSESDWTLVLTQALLDRATSLKGLRVITPELPFPLLQETYECLPVQKAAPLGHIVFSQLAA